MDPLTLELLKLIGSAGAPAVAVILAIKYTINGMRADVTEIKQDVKSIKGQQGDHGERLVRLETLTKPD